LKVSYISQYGPLLGTYAAIIKYGRYVGTLSFGVILGFYFLIRLKLKFRKHIFLIIVLLFFTPIINIGTYVIWVFLIFSPILISIALETYLNHLKSHSRDYNLKIMSIFLIAILYSAIFQFWAPGFAEDEKTYNEKYVEEIDYQLGIYYKYNAHSSFISDDTGIQEKVQAIAVIIRVDREADTKSYELYPIYSEAFWKEGWYFSDSEYDNLGEVDERIMSSVYNSDYNAKYLLERYEIGYSISNNRALMDSNPQRTFFESIEVQTYKFYVSEKATVRIV